MGNGRSLAVLIGPCLLTAVAFAHRCGKASAGNAEHGESVLAKTPPMGWNSWDKKFHYVAAFNRGSVGSDVKYSWKDLGLEGNEYNLRDLWNRKDMGEASELAVKLPAHGCAMFRLSR